MKSRARHHEILSIIKFQLIYIISIALGLAPCNIKLSARANEEIGFTLVYSCSRVKCVYCILLIVLYILNITCGVSYLDDVPFPNDSSTARTIGYAISVIGNVTAIVITIFYTIRQRDIIRIGNQLHEFDQRYRHQFIGTNINLWGHFLISIAIAFVPFIWIGVLITELMEPSGQVILVIYGVNGMFFSWVLVQYTLLVYVLHNRFRDLNDVLLDTSTCPLVLEAESRLRRSFANDQRSIIGYLMNSKRARNVIYKISRDISRFYSFPVLLVIFHGCCCSVQNFYFYIISLMDPEYYKIDGETSTYVIFWALLYSYPIVILSVTVNKFHAETDRTADIVYDIMETYAWNKDIKSELKIFAVELIHKKVSFDACGLFSLDCTLLHSIFGMIVTYLLICVQFKPSQ